MISKPKENQKNCTSKNQKKTPKNHVRNSKNPQKKPQNQKPKKTKFAKNQKTKKNHETKKNQKKTKMSTDPNPLSSLAERAARPLSIKSIV